MTTRSKIAAGILLLATTLQGASLLDLYVAHREDILSGATSFVEGNYFGVGEAVSRSSAEFAVEAMKGRSRLMAMDDLLANVQCENLQLPQGFTVEERELLKRELRAVCPVRESLRGLEVLEIKRHKTQYTTVVAIPQEKVAHVPRVDYAQLLPKLLEESSLLHARSPFPYEMVVKLDPSRVQGYTAVAREGWEDLIAKARFPQLKLMRMREFAGRYPFGSNTPSDGNADYDAANAAYARGKLEAAYDGFVKCAAETLHADAFNMAGNVARRLGKDAEAAVLLLHAAYLNPSSPHPWVHLAYVAQHQGNEDLCTACCDEAAKRNPDEWTLQQIARLQPPVEEHVEYTEEAYESEEISTDTTDETPSNEN